MASEWERITAIHESAHGVVGHLEGMVLVKLSLKWDDDSFGRAHLKYPEGFDPAKDACMLMDCHTALAGACAEAIARLTDPQNSRKLDNEDWAIPERYAKDRYPDSKEIQESFVSDRVSETIAKLRDEHVWNAVLAVADAAGKHPDRELLREDAIAEIEKHVPPNHSA